MCDESRKAIEHKNCLGAIKMVSELKVLKQDELKEKNKNFPHTLCKNVKLSPE